MKATPALISRRSRRTEEGTVCLARIPHGMIIAQLSGDRGDGAQPIIRGVTHSRYRRVTLIRRN
jgi:hypothetical protein